MKFKTVKTLKLIKILILSTLVLFFILTSSFSSQVLQYPLFQIIDADGNPVSGGLLSFYKPGLSISDANRKNAYSDKTLATPIANPYTLNTKGEYPGLIYLSGLYKINVTTSSGAAVTGFPIDNVEGSGSTILDFVVLSDYADFEAAVTAISTTQTTLYIDTDSTISSDTTVLKTLSLYFFQGNTLTIATTKTLTILGSMDNGVFLKFEFEGSGSVSFAGNDVIPEYYPEWLGATTDTGTDASSAINNLIANIDRGVIKLQTGRYDTGTTTISVTGTGITLRGSGKRATIIQIDNAGGAVISLGTAAGAVCIGCVVEDMTLSRDTGTPGAGAIGLQGTMFQDARASNLYITDHLYNIEVRSEDGFSSRSNIFTFENIYIEESTSAYVHISDANRITFTNCEFGAGGKLGQETESPEYGVLFTDDPRDIRFDSCQFNPSDTNATTNFDAFYIGAYTGTNLHLQIVNSYVVGVDDTMDFAGAEQVHFVFIGNYFEDDIKINGSVAEIIIVGNELTKPPMFTGTFTTKHVMLNVGGDKVGAETIDFGNAAVGLFASSTWAVTGVVLGDYVTCSFSLDLQNLSLVCAVNSNGNLEATVLNNTAGDINLDEGVVYYRVSPNSK